MKFTNEHVAATAYAQGRLDAGEPAFMDPDGFTHNATVGAFAFHYAKAAAEGHELVLITAWSVFMETAGRTVVHDDADTHGDHMAMAAQDGLDAGACGMSRTFAGGPTVRCSLRLGHSPRAKHTYNLNGTQLEWTTEESDQILADRVHYVPASTYSTEVTRTAYPVSTDAQVGTDLSRVTQEV